MTEYIDREAVLLEINRRIRRQFLCIANVITIIKDAPAADVAPVVRCCDCKYHHDCGTHFCDRLGMDCPDDSEFFCKYGARMAGGAE